MVSLTSRVEPCTLREVKALLSYATRLEMVDPSNISIDGSSPSAHMAAQTHLDRGCNFQNSNHGQDRGNGNNNHGSGRHNNYRGRGGRFNSNYKPCCQICKVLGHTADRCYERHNPNFQPNTSRRPSNNGGQCNPEYQTGGQYTTSAHAANVAGTLNGGFSHDMNWYPDSGASSCVTHDLGNLNIASDYQRQENLQIANGTGLKISHW